MNVSSTESTSTYTNAAYSNKGMSGMVSGLDTESLVQSMLSNIQTKIDKKTQEQTRLTWKQDMYRDVIDKINTFQTKYCSMTSDTCLRSGSLFGSKTTTSDSAAVSVAADSSAVAGDVSVAVARLATATSLRSGKASSGAITFSGNVTMDRSVKLTIGEKDVSVDLAGAADNADIRDRINNAIADAGLTGSLTLSDEDGTLSYSGAEKLSISGGKAGLAMLGLKSTMSATETTEGDEAVTTYRLTTGELDLAPEGLKSTFTISLDGVDKEFSLADGEDMSALQSQITKAFGSNVKLAENEDGSYTMSTGVGQTVSITGSDGALSSLGLEGAASTRVATTAKIGTLNLNGGKLDADAYKFSINGTEIAVTKDDSLADVMNRVNSADCGVTMTYDSLQDQFLLTSENTGAGFDIQLSDPDGFLGKLGMTGADAVTTSGQNAVATVNGTLIERANNSFTFDGLTLTLHATTGSYNIEEDAQGNLLGVTANGTESNANIRTEANTERVMDTLTSFVEDYNKLIDELNDQTHEDATYKKYAPLTDAQKKEMSDKEVELWEEKAKTGLLHNDSDISSYLLNMRKALYSQYDEKTLSQFGINSSKDYKDYGKLEIDKDKLQKALDTNPEELKSLFTGNNGLAAKLDEVCSKTANTSSGSAGVLVRLAGVKGKATESENTLSKQISSLNDRISSFKQLYETRKTRYWNQFNSMETALSSLNSTSSYLTNMLA